MPQFEFANFAPQLAWLTICFAILYFGVVRLTLPRIGQVVEGREAKVRGDIADAETAKAEADRVREAYEAAMASARSQAQGAINDAKAKATRAGEARLAEADRGFEAKASAAAAALEAARVEAMAEVDRIAADAAAEIVARVGGSRPAEDVALAAVRATAEAA
ncbi:MAG TPA: ATPase [Sphingomonadaceae bacterium]|nr:ATPase [Sphingomonadaceae bacterium]